MRSDRRAPCLSVLLALVIGTTVGPLFAGQTQRGLTVTGTIALTGSDRVSDRSGVVVWLSPIGEVAPVGEASSKSRAKILQKGKRFIPQVLVIPVGSVVDFPNLDPILHNVFSLFEGRRFDLGLYEEGSSKSVTFPVPGVSYVFCNIHPEMSAAIVTVDSTYYTTSTTAGTVSIPDVPPGRYRLSVWHDRFKPEQAAQYPKEISVSPSATSLGTLTFVDAGRPLATHKNKFGQDYPPPNSSGPYAR